VETKYLDPGGRTGPQDVTMVLNPIQSRQSRLASPAESTKTLVNESIEHINVVPLGEFGAEDSYKDGALKRVKGTSLGMSSLSLPPDRVERSPRVSGARADAAACRSKTADMGKMITEVEMLSGSDSGSNGMGSGRKVAPYVRRRYTDSRHPTTELPDVRGGLEPLPSVRDRPTADRRSKSKEAVSAEEGTSGRSPPRSPGAAITERDSYKRWQMSAGRNNSDTDAFV